MTAGNKRREAKGGEEGGGGVLKIKLWFVCRELADAVVVSRDSAETTVIRLSWGLHTVLITLWKYLVKSGGR